MTTLDSGPTAPEPADEPGTGAAAGPASPPPAPAVAGPAAAAGTAAPGDEAGGPLSAPYTGLTLGIVSVVLLIAFEGMAVGTAMPVAVSDLDGVPLYALAFSAYFTTSLFAMVLAGVRCDASGPRGPLFAGIAAFAAGLVLSGTATSIWPFLLGRAVQGFGGGLVIVALYVVVGLTYPPRLRPRVFSAFSGAWVVPSIVGPPVAGAITDHAGWRWVFLSIPLIVLLPVATMLPRLTTLSGGAAAAQGAADPDEADGPGGPPPPPAGPRAGRRRIAAAFGAAVGAGLLQYGGQTLTGHGAWFVLAGAALMAPTVPRLLPKGTLRAARGLPSVMLGRALLAGTFFSVESFVPLMLVGERGFTPTAAGMTLTVGALSWALGSWYQGRQPRERRPSLVRYGFLGVAVAVGAAALATLPALPAWTVTAGWFFGGAGMGLAVSSISVLTLELSPADKAGENSASLQVSDALGTIVFVGLAGAIFAAFHRGEGRDGPVFGAVFVVMTVVALVGAVFATRVRDHR